MKTIKEIVRELKNGILQNIPEEIIEELVCQVPDPKMLQVVAPLAAEALSDLPEGTDPKKAVAFAMNKLKKKSERKKDAYAGNAKVITREYFDSLLLEQRLMDAAVPDTTLELFGETFSTPIMTAALSHLKNNAPDIDNGLVGYGKAAKLADCVHWVGMSENEEFASILETGAKTIRIIKPYADEEKIYDQLRFSQEAGAFAVGMDIDHTFTEEGNVDTVMGEKMEIKSAAVMENYIRSVSLPFVVKGVLSVRDAARCAQIGAKGIVVSHHGGRMPYAVPPLQILPEIVKEVGTVMPVFVDCGICSGADAYKAMALGATAVSVGTHLIPFLKKGPKAVAERIKEMTAELKGLMANTGVRDVYSFDASVIHRKGDVR